MIIRINTNRHYIADVQDNSPIMLNSSTTFFNYSTIYLFKFKFLIIFKEYIFNFLKFHVQHNKI